MTLKVWWFPEYTPQEQAIFDAMKHSIAKEYAHYGYQNIETPAVERHDILLKWGEESSQQIFWLYGMAQWPEDAKDYGLHFDLTVPFTRYVLDHQGKLVFPFKRQQIQPVRRGERSQKGRYKQFYQADIDTLWYASETRHYLYYDAETLQALRNVLWTLQEQFFPEDTRTIHVNHRGILQWLFRDICKENMEQVSSLYKLFDDYYKIDTKTFLDRMQNIWLDKQQQQIIQQFGTMRLDELSDSQISTHPSYIQWVQHLQHIRNLATAQDTGIEIVFDPYIVRGLDYYTGLVFETMSTLSPEYGSLCSWGRYEKLTQSLDPNAMRMDGVGGSIGLSRIFNLYLSQKQGKQAADSFSTTQVLLIHFQDTLSATVDLAQQLRKARINTEVYPEADKLKKQFSYANRKNIPYVILIGEEELAQWVYTLKDMKKSESSTLALDTLPEM